MDETQNQQNTPEHNLYSPPDPTPDTPTPEVTPPEDSPPPPPANYNSAEVNAQILANSFTPSNPTSPTDPTPQTPNQPKKNTGFIVAIIVGIVIIAFAAFFIIPAFVLLPNAQRTQRDIQRRDDINHFIRMIDSFQLNNRGSIPAEEDLDGFLRNYLRIHQNEFTVPGGDPYIVTIDPTGQSAATDTIAYSGPGHQCDGDNFTPIDNQQSAAARIRLERGGYYCRDTHGQGTERQATDLGPMNDTRRRNTIAFVFSQVNSFQTNNRAAVPTDETFPNFVAEYLDVDYRFDGFNIIFDPTGRQATINTVAYSGPGFRCDQNGNFTTVNHQRTVAARIRLDTGGYYCQDNQ